MPNGVRNRPWAVSAVSKVKNPDSESRRLAYLLPFTTMMSSVTKAQRHRVKKNNKIKWLHCVNLKTFTQLFLMVTLHPEGHYF